MAYNPCDKDWDEYFCRQANELVTMSQQWGQELLSVQEQVNKERESHQLSIVEKILSKRRRFNQKEPRKNNHDSNHGKNNSKDNSSDYAHSSPESYSVYQVFTKQSEAFRYYDTKVMEFWNQQESSIEQFAFVPPYKIFSYELNNKGKRNFLVCTLDTLWKRFYKSMPHERHLYEIIREDTPVHLYFDIEFKHCENDITRENSDIDSESLMDYFLSRVCQHLKDLFDLSVSRQDIVDFESSSIYKFSRHVLVRFPNGHMFRSAQHAGEFLLSLIEVLMKERHKQKQNKNVTTHSDKTEARSLQASDLWVRNKDGGDDFFADIAVYTRNRAMRTYLSCKYGKRMFLMASTSNQFEFKANKNTEFFCDLPEIDTVSSVASLQKSTGLQILREQPGDSSATCDDSDSFLLNDDSLQKTNILTVQTGSKRWEQAMWYASFITDRVPPLYIWHKYQTSRSAYKPSSNQTDSSETTDVIARAIQPSSPQTRHPFYEPTTKRPLLYMFDPHQEEVSLCDTPQSSFSSITDDQQPSELTNGDAYGCTKALILPRYETQNESTYVRTGIIFKYHQLMKSYSVQINETGEHNDIWDVFDEPDIAEIHSTTNISADRSNDSSSEMCFGQAGIASGEGIKSCPFPQLSQKIVEIASKAHVEAKIRSWEGKVVRLAFTPIAQDPSQGLEQTVHKLAITQMTFHISNNRWCARIGRFHKSNHVAYVVDLLRGTCSQICMDPACRGYRSRAILLPQNCLPSQAPENMRLILQSEQM